MSYEWRSRRCKFSRFPALRGAPYEPHALRDIGQACAIDEWEYDCHMKLVNGAMMIVRMIFAPFVLIVVVGIALGRGLLNRIR